MLCPVCGTRRAKRNCPALGRHICAVCCGTKRLTEIPCPADCGYLAAARDHPSAIVVRRQRQDVEFVTECVRDLSERQSQLFLIIATFIVRTSADATALQPLIDDDVAEAMDAMAATYETSIRGVIYEHRPASLPAQRLVTALKPIVDEAGKGGGTSFERDAAVVMRRIAQAVAAVRHADDVEERHADAGARRRLFVALLQRIFSKAPEPAILDGSYGQTL